MWIAVTFLTPPEPQDVLQRFYRRVRPHAAGWQPIARLASDVPETRDLAANLRSWLLGCAMVYSALFGIGELCFQRVGQGLSLLALAAACAWLISREIARQSWREPSGS